MTEMLERVERAMKERASKPLPHSLDAAWDCLARAVMEEMRVPTDAMVKAAVMQSSFDDIVDAEVIDMWQAMFDEALRE